jgi:NAD-dependent SIR2 family protein deacetylase
MFGESIPKAVKTAAEQAIDSASRLLVVGSSLATYSAFRLAKRARERGMPVGILNLGGVRGEGEFFEDTKGCMEKGVRLDMDVNKVLPKLVESLDRMGWRGPS